MLLLLFIPLLVLPLSPVASSMERVTGVTIPPILPERDHFEANQRLIQHATNVFCTGWQKEISKKVAKEMQVGDMVLLMDKNFNQSNWPQAFVTAAEPGTDGFARTVRVRTSNEIEYHRDIGKLALLEAAGEMFAMVTSKRCLTNNIVSTPIANYQATQGTQGTQDTQGTQGTQDMQDTQGTQGIQELTQPRRSKRIQEK
jgi:hypothetical protein